MTCADLGAFCEGELDAPDADAFRAHLPTCEACQRGLEDWMQIAAHASDALPRIETAKLERVKGAIAGLGEDAEPPARWQGRVMDAVAWQARVQQVVREAADREIRKLLGCGAGMDPDTSGAKSVNAIADRVASQLAGAAPALSEGDRTIAEWLKSLATVGILVHQHDGVSTRHSENCQSAVRLLDRLLGASR